jgi:hypothetical protein
MQSRFQSEDAVHRIRQFLIVLACCGCAGEWKPTGDGKTVVNTRTGAIKVASTGEDIREFNARKAREQQAREANAIREGQRRLEIALQAQEARQAEQEARQAEQEASQKAMALENGVHYHAAQRAICSILPSEVSTHPGEWYFSTKPFRLDRFPTKSEALRVLRLIELLTTNGGTRDKTWLELDGHLRQLKFGGDGIGKMLRTPEQLAESFAARSAADDRDAKRTALRQKKADEDKARGEAAFLANSEALRNADGKWLMLKRGISREQVRSLLGAPNRTSAIEWTYDYPRMISPDSTYIVDIDGVVRFGDSGLVESWSAPRFK